MYINHAVYKPWLVGVFNKYTTQVWGQWKFATDKPQAHAKGKEFISGKLLMNKDKGHNYVCQIHHSSRGSYDMYYGDIIQVLYM